MSGATGLAHSSTGRGAAGPGRPPRPLELVTALAPGALIIVLGFASGGYFPATTAWLSFALAVVALAVIALRGRQLSNSVRIVGASLALFALWSALSALWSRAPTRALLEFDRNLLYLSALVVFASTAGTRAGLRWMLRGIAFGIVVICAAALLARLTPGIWPLAADLHAHGLDYPVSYANALALLASMGLLTSAHLASSQTEPSYVRLLAVGSLPALGVTLALTRSYGAILVGLGGALLLAWRHRGGLALTYCAAAVPTALAVVATTDAGDLATANATTPAAVKQGANVAVVTLLCCLTAGLLQQLLLRRGSLARLHHRRLGVLATLLVWVAVTGGGTVVAAGTATDNLDVGVTQQSRNQAGPQNGARKVESRTLGGFEARLAYWQTAGENFLAAPLLGRGAGTYEVLWDEARYRGIAVTDSHSLLLEVLAELGVVGFAFLAAGLGTALLVSLRHSGGSRPTVPAVVVGVAFLWAVHASVDWDWEMPVLTIPVLALLGAGLQAPGVRSTHQGSSGKRPDRRAVGRRGVALSLLLPPGVVVAAIPLLVGLSQSRLDTAVQAYREGDCAHAIRHAHRALALVSFRPEPYEVIGFCSLREGLPASATGAFRAAARRDPQNWEYRYGAALALHAAKHDPSAEVRAASERNPHGRLVEQARDGRFPSLSRLEGEHGPFPLD